MPPVRIDALGTAIDLVGSAEVIEAHDGHPDAQRLVTAAVGEMVKHGVLTRA